MCVYRRAAYSSAAPGINADWGLREVKRASEVDVLRFNAIGVADQVAFVSPSSSGEDIHPPGDISAQFDINTPRAPLLYLRILR